MTVPSVPASSWFALGAIVVLALALSVDRELLVLLTGPIKRTMSASDLQIGLLQGAGVALVGAIVSYPLGWLADRYDRRAVLAGCIGVWAVAVVSSALAPNFGILLVAGALSAVGPAGLMPVSFSIIPLLFTGAQRQLANSVFSIAAHMGRGLVVLACGGIILGVEGFRPLLPAALQSLEGWRVALVAATLPVPLLLWIAARMPRLPGAVHVGGEGSLPGAGIGMLAFVAEHRRAFVGLFGGITVAVLSFSPLMVWLPVSVMRQFGDSPAETSKALGVCSIVAALAGVLITTSGLHRLQRRLGPDMPIVVITASTGVAVLTTLALLAATTALQTYVTMAAQLAFMMAAIMVFPTMLQDMAPSALRGRMAALLGMVTTLGSAGGPPLVGAVSDRLVHRADGLLLAVVSLAALGFSVSAAMFWSARRPFALAVAAARRLDTASS